MSPEAQPQPAGKRGNANATHAGKQWQFLTKLNILSPENPAIPLAEVYSREMETSLHPETSW